MKNSVKNLLFGRSNIQKIKAGIGKGVFMKIDVSNKAQRILGLDEYEIQKVFKSYSQIAKYFFDIGASDGYYSLLFRKLNPNGSIYMFEAQERFRKEIESNFSLNSFPINYQHFAKYASDKIDNNNVTIDSIFQKRGESLLFKIDVDGGEEVVLKGMEQTMINNKCLFVIETHSKELEESCINFLNKNGYSCKVINHAWFRFFLPEERVIEHNRWLVAEKKS
jgi:precorrin-6B methylase 2